MFSVVLEANTQRTRVATAATVQEAKQRGLYLHQTTDAPFDRILIVDDQTGETVGVFLAPAPSVVIELPDGRFLVTSSQSVLATRGEAEREAARRDRRRARS